MTKHQDVKFSEFPGRNTPLLDRPFGNASPGCFVFAHNPRGLDLNFVPIQDELEPANGDYDIDSPQWALGRAKNPLIKKRYSTLDVAQRKYAEEIVRGSTEHKEILDAFIHKDLCNVPSRLGVEATIILSSANGDVILVGNHNDRVVNPTRSPIPCGAFAVTDGVESSAQELLIRAICEITFKQLGIIQAQVGDQTKIHSIYTLSRRLQTQIACTIDLRNSGVLTDAIDKYIDRGNASFNSRYSGLEYLSWDALTVERFAASNCFRSTKQNLSSVFLAAAADGLIPEEKAYEYIGARSATNELAIASNTDLNTLLDRPCEIIPIEAGLGTR